MSERDRIKTIRDAVEESTAALEPWRKRAHDELLFSAGNQWSMEQREALTGKFAFTFNIIKKHLHVISGRERRNRSDLKVLPIEGSDDAMAAVWSSVLKWIMADNRGAYIASEAFLDAINIGLGWVTLDVRRELQDLLADPEGNGEIIISTGNPFSILPDPNWSKLDLSDCSYIANATMHTKGDLKTLYPTIKDELDKLTKGPRLVPSIFKKAYEDDERLEVVEYWKRSYERRAFLVDLRTGESTEGESKADLEAFIQGRPDAENLRILEGTDPIITLDTLIADEILVPSNGKNPLELSTYPFIPMRGYFNSIIPEAEWKFQGITRNLVDMQKLVNKMESEALYQFVSNPSKTTFVGYSNDAVSNEEILNAGGNAAHRIVRVPDISQIREQQNQMVDPSALMFSDRYQGMMNLIGNNPDLMGQVSEVGAPGIAIELRMAQGEVNNEILFDNHRLSLESLGRVLVELINKTYSLRKIQRIVGNEVQIPADFEARRKTARFDVSVSLFGESPTFRYGRFLNMMNMVEKGIIKLPVELIIDLLPDFDQALKDRILSSIRAEQQGTQPPQVPGPVPPEGVPPQGGEPPLSLEGTGLSPEILAALSNLNNSQGRIDESIGDVQPDPGIIE